MRLQSDRIHHESRRSPLSFMPLSAFGILVSFQAPTIFQYIHVEIYPDLLLLQHFLGRPNQDVERIANVLLLGQGVRTYNADHRDTINHR